MKGFDFEEERIEQEIVRLRPKRVLLQLPEGLKSEAIRLAKLVEKTGALPVISADPCYGPCDIISADAKSIGIDLIIHFGHSRMLNHETIPIIYVEARATIPVDPILENLLPLIKEYNKIGLATTVQHVQTLDYIREILGHAGKTVVIGNMGQMDYPGQVSGCNYSNIRSIANDVEAFLFVGGGRFHAIGIALTTSKPTIILDPYEKRVYSINDEAQRILKKRWEAIQEAKDANTYGVLVSLKFGQQNMKEALKIIRAIKSLGKTALIFAIREILPEILMQFPTVDAYVNTACPRISVGPSRFLKPVLTGREFRVISGETTWKTLLKEGLLGK